MSAELWNAGETIYAGSQVLKEHQNGDFRNQSLTPLCNLPFHTLHPSFAAPGLKKSGRHLMRRQGGRNAKVGRQYANSRLFFPQRRETIPFVANWFLQVV
jgi:hypothetical protein